MGSNNKYGSLTETFMGAPLIELATLSLKATPPADLNLALADFNLGVDLFTGPIGGSRRGHFRLNDIPRITGLGLWCNIADGLVQIDQPDDFLTGLGMYVNGHAFNAANVEVQPTLFTTSVFSKVQEFNQIYDVDYLEESPNISYTLAGNPADSGSGYFRLTARFNATTSKFSTITVDPAFAAKPFYIRPMVVVEHTFPLLLSGF